MQQYNHPDQREFSNPDAHEVERRGPDFMTISRVLGFGVWVRGASFKDVGVVLMIGIETVAMLD